MKKAILVIFLFIMTFSLVLTSSGNLAFAATESADTSFSTDNKGSVFRVPQGSNYTVYMNTGEGEIALFDIPETYYFKYVKSNPTGDKHYIEYNGITGGIYIKTNSAMALTDVDIEPRGGFTLNVTFDNEVKYYYYDEFFTEDTLTSPGTLTITLIGFSNQFKFDTTTLTNPAYVKIGDTYGFIDSALLKVKDTNTLVSTYISNIPLHSNYQTKIVDKDATTSPTNGNKLTRTILIIGIVIPALIIVLLLFMPRKQSRYDYDRNNAGEYGTSPYDQPRSRYNNEYEDDYQNRRRYDNDDDYYDNRGR